MNDYEFVHYDKTFTVLNFSMIKHFEVWIKRMNDYRQIVAKFEGFIEKNPSEFILN